MQVHAGAEIVFRVGLVPAGGNFFISLELSKRTTQFFTYATILATGHPVNSSLITTRQPGTQGRQTSSNPP